MSRPLDFAKAAADHREAIEAFARTVESLDRDAWNVSREPGKWSPAEIAQHLILSYGPPLAELAGGAGFSVRLPWWKRTVLRWKMLPKILYAEKFPKGAPAPREARPKAGAASPEEAARLLRENAGQFELRLSEGHAARSVRLTHSYFGKLTAPQILKLMAVHAHHHRAQLPTVIS
jgi:hypothetical protein